MFLALPTEEQIVARFKYIKCTGAVSSKVQCGYEVLARGNKLSLISGLPYERAESSVYVAQMLLIAT